MNQQKTIKRTIEPADILDYNQFLQQRPKLYCEIQELKKSRRITVGPDITLYFENFRTLQWQIQEMLRIEKGGQEQLNDELQAYAPLIPKCLSNGDQELVATLMIEIEDLNRRKTALYQLSGIEKYVCFSVLDQKIVAVAEQDVERTAEDGKTSSIHFLRFQFNKNAVDNFSKNIPCILSINHPHYYYANQLTIAQQSALCLDFDL